MTTSKRRQKFSDPEYRSQYAESLLDAAIATQLRVLREQRELTQQALGDKAGMKQSRISTMESASYSSWNITTLKKLARALDLALVVRFESFGTLLSDLDTMDRSGLERPTFDEDPVFRTAHSGDFIEQDATGTPVPASVVRTSESGGRVLSFPRVTDTLASANVQVSAYIVNEGVACVG